MLYLYDPLKGHIALDVHDVLLKLNGTGQPHGSSFLHAYYFMPTLKKGLSFKQLKYYNRISYNILISCFVGILLLAAGLPIIFQKLVESLMSPVYTGLNLFFMGAVAACLILLMVFVWLWHRNIQVLANHVKQLSLAALARSNLNAHAKNFVLLLVDFFQPKPVAGVQFILLTCVSLTLVGQGLLVNLHMGLWVAAFAVVFLFWQLFWQRGIKPWLANRIETLQTFHERSQDKVLEGVEGHWGQTYGLTQQSNYQFFG
ncbi:MAG: ABC transporter ATP-binding protein [Bacteroidales bacterium]|nr:ABC transporter ATP-binding protein [Bacteroidales bacterium]